MLPAILLALHSGCGSAPAIPESEARAMKAALMPADDLVAAHNRWRERFKVQKLEWSATAAQVAQSWADTLSTENCEMRHNPDPARRKGFGENIYRYWSTKAYDGYQRDSDTVVDRWGGEEQWYDSQSHECEAPEGAGCAHFTQLVWQYSTHVGCGRARCDKSEVRVCNYFPRGNMENVEPFAADGSGS